MRKKQYISPTLNVVEFRVEYGYALSNYDNNITMTTLQAITGFSTQGIELWEEPAGDLFSGGWTE